MTISTRKPTYAARPVSILAAAGVLALTASAADARGFGGSLGGTVSDGASSKSTTTEHSPLIMKVMELIQAGAQPTAAIDDSAHDKDGLTKARSKSCDAEKEQAIPAEVEAKAATTGRATKPLEPMPLFF